MNSCIKYYGGKHYFRNIILSNFPSRFEYRRYVEGFGGSGSILFMKEPDPIEVYNDLESNVYSIFKILSDKDMSMRFKEKLDITPYSRRIWKEYKESLSDPEIHLSVEERGYRFFYVNRTSFNGVGGFSVCRNDSRRNMMKTVSDYLSSVDNLMDYHQRISSVLVENLDIFDLIEKYDEKDTFFYLDPPYVQSTRRSSQKYREEFDDEQHRRLIEVCNNIKGKVLISGYDSPLYDNLRGFDKMEFPSPNARSDSVEVLWSNYEMPCKNSPSDTIKETY